MSNGFSIGDQVRRVNDDFVGVVEHIGPMGGISVRWQSGVLSVMVPSQIKPA